MRYRELKELDRHQRDITIDRDENEEILTHTRSIDEKYYKIKHITSENVRYSPMPHVHRESRDMVETNLTDEEAESFFEQWNSNCPDIGFQSIGTTIGTPIGTQTSDVDESDESDDPDYVPTNSDTESHDSEYDSEFQLTDDSEYDSPEEYL